MEADNLKKVLNNYKHDIHSVQVMFMRELEQVMEMIEKLEDIDNLNVSYDTPGELIMRYKGLHHETLSPMLKRIELLMNTAQSKLSLVVHQINEVEDGIIQFRNREE